MKNRLIASLVVLGALVATAAIAADPPKAGSTDAKDLKWLPFSPDPKGPYIAWVIGDGKGTGPQEFILKVPAGYKVGEHFHTGDYSAVVLAGAQAHGDDEKTAKIHTTGGMWNEPGKHNHFDACVSKEDCMMVITFPVGPVDFVPVGADGKPMPMPAPAKTK